MQPLTEQQIRRSFVNASKGEATRASIPDLDTIDWDALDYLGWTDAKRPGLSYVVLHLDDAVRGIGDQATSEERVLDRPACRGVARADRTVRLPGHAGS